MPAIKKAFNFLGDDKVELSTENDALKNKIGSYDEKWLEEPEAKLSKQIDDEKITNLIIPRMKKHMEKHLKNGLYKLWEREFDNIVSKRDTLQDLNID